jgi:peptidoglycan/LPS O-acetylase OafA/YrhL
VFDSLRGIAAFIVVVHHCLLTQPAFSDFFFSIWQTPAYGPVQYLLFYTPIRIVWDGFEAVTLFYVLSGLVLMLPWAERRPPKYAAFCIKRICRIYLPYCAAIVFAAVPNMLLSHRTEVAGASEWVRTMTWSNPVTPTVLIDHALMLGHYNTINGVIHSLVWEMRVSLLFPFLMLPIAHWRLRGAVAVAVGLLAFMAAMQLLVAQSGAGLGPAQAGSDPGLVGALLLEAQKTAYYTEFFVIGAVLALYLSRIRRLLTRMPPTLRYVLLGVGLLIFQGHWTQVRPVQAVFVAFGSALVIAASLSPGAIERTLLLTPLRFLGRISYSLYLVHVPLLLTAVLLLQDIVPMPVVLVCVPPTAVALGWLFHLAVAEPSAALGQRLAKRLDRSAPRRLAQPQAELDLGAR